MKCKLMPPKVIAQHVEKTYDTAAGPFIAIHNFNLTVDDGEFVCIVGPSGCGKSTFLRIVAGLEQHTGGTVQIMPGNDSRKPLNNVVFQEYAIFPWKTLLDNVAFGLQMRGIGPKAREAVALDWLERVGLRKFARYYPHQISGGMKQRVSIARALANDPEVLLMDEPLGALDAQTRTVLQEELLTIWEANRKTVIYVTHSLDEAILLGDRVLLMTANPGTCKAIFPVPLARPRTIAISGTTGYTDLKLQIWESLRVEVERAMEVQRG